MAYNPLLPENFSVGGFDKVPDNSVILIVGPNSVERLHRKEFTSKKDGRVVPAKDYTAVVLTAVAPESADPTKEYRMELGCGNIVMPNAAGTGFDYDRDTGIDPRTGKLFRLNAGTAYAVFLASLARAGAENGLYNGAVADAINESVDAFTGLKFHSGGEARGGRDGIDPYTALVATAIYSWGDEPTEDPDVDVIINALTATLTKNPKGMTKALLLNAAGMALSDVQKTKLAESVNDPSWLKEAQAAGILQLLGDKILPPKAA